MNLIKDLNIKQIIYYLLSIIVFFAIIYFVYLFSNMHVIEHDDSIMASNGTFIYKYFINVYKSKYIANFLCVFFGNDIPKFLSIHPVVWIQTGGAVIKGIFTAILVFSISSCLFLFNKKNILLPIISLLLYLYIQNSVIGHYQSELYASFYCFTFQCLFYALFWRKLIFEYKEENSTKADIFIILLLAFLCGMSSEMTAIATFLSLLLFIVYMIISKKKLSKSVIYSFIFLIIGMTIYFTHPTFFSYIHAKNASNINIINGAITLLPEFLNNFKIVFINHFLVLIVAILLLNIVIFKESKDKTIPILFLLFIIGNILFYSILIFAGKNTDNQCYAIHLDMILQMKLLLLIAVFLQLSFIHQRKLLYYLSIVIIGISLFLSVDWNIIKDFIIDKSNNSIWTTKEIYKERYIYERIAAYYIYSGNDYTVSIPYVLDSYLTAIYGFNINNDNVIYYDSLNDAYNEYLKNGGCEIPENEVNKADFQKLLDKDYVLTCKY